MKYKKLTQCYHHRQNYPSAFLYFVLLSKHRALNYYAAAIFIVAALSDMVDGMIARKYQLVSNVGKFMDPIADKILAMAALLLLMEWGKLTAWVCIILLAREFIISGSGLSPRLKAWCWPQARWASGKPLFRWWALRLFCWKIPSTPFGIFPWSRFWSISA